MTAYSSHLQIGRAYAMAGETAKAKAAYRNFLTLRKDTDRDIPNPKQSKNRVREAAIGVEHPQQRLVTEPILLAGFGGCEPWSKESQPVNLHNQAIVLKTPPQGSGAAPGKSIE